MRNSRLESPITLEGPETEAVQRLGSDLGGCVAALEALKGSLVLLSHASGESVWQFKHPTIGDAYATVLVQSPEHLGIYIRGTAPERLVYQVTCGDVGIEKAVIVPKPLFLQVLAKLNEMTQSKAYKSPLLSKFGARRDLQGFLARRCSKEFLSLYLAQHPELLDQVARPGLFLDTVPEVRLAERMHEFGLLPEDKRRTFVETVSDYATKGEDTYGLNNLGIRSIFTDEEHDELVERVRNELLPRLDDVRRDWEGNQSSDERPEEHMQSLLTSFDTLAGVFAVDEDAMRIIKRETAAAQEWIAENTPEEPERSPRVLSVAETAPQPQPQSARSIFDDIDDRDEDSTDEEAATVIG